MANIPLKIVTPTEVIYNDQVAMVVACGVEGEFAILAGHTPFLSSLKTGFIKIYDAAEQVVKEFFIDSGLCQHKEDGCVIFVERLIDLSQLKSEDVATQINSYQQQIAENIENNAITQALQQKLESLEIIKSALHN